MADSESIECPCSNIAIMQLFHELKQSYPTVPDQIVSKVIQENYHDKSACETILRQESHTSLQSYPGAIISGNCREGPERGSICSQCPASRSVPQCSGMQQPVRCHVPDTRTHQLRSTPHEKSAFPSLEGGGIYSRDMGGSEEGSAEKGAGRDSKGETQKAGKAGCVTGGGGPSGKSVSEGDNAGGQGAVDGANGEGWLRQCSGGCSAGTGLSENGSSNSSRSCCCECGKERKSESLERPDLCGGPPSSKGAVGYRDAGRVSWNVEDGGRLSGGSSGVVGSTNSGEMGVHNYQVAVQYSMQPSLSVHPGGQQRSFTTVNLSLRPPSSEPQPPIEIHSGQDLTYTTSVFDAKKGVRSQLQIRIGPGGGGTVSACRTYISSPQTRFSCRSPYCTPHISSGFQCQNNHHLKALLEKQKERKDVLARELRKEKGKLLSMQNDVRLMKASIAQKYSPHLLTKLKSEIEKLRTECERLTAAVDLYSDAQNHLPLGETDEEFYRNIYTGQSLEREGSWSCQLCTFRNHPLLSVCEECEMPRISLGTQVMDVTTHLSVLPNNNTSFCPGGGTSTSASLITAPLQER